MGLFKRITGRTSSAAPPASATNEDEPVELESESRKKSVIALVPLSEVTEASLKVFRQLPAAIRHDPSMISFQQENERWKGEIFFVFKIFLLLLCIASTHFVPFLLFLSFSLLQRELSNAINNDDSHPRDCDMYTLLLPPHVHID
jgi:hypothetical protein